MSDYPNSGNFFAAANMKVARQGKLDVNGTDHEIAIVQVITKNKKTVFEVYQKVGVLYENDNKTEKQDWDISGTITILGEKLRMWCRKRFDKSNNAYTRASVAPHKETSSDEKDQHAQETHDEIEDDIPF